ncbi:MAG: ferrous iron transport protein B [Pseudomonadota bacterium]
MKKIRVALAGNPNSGKTSIFNELVGAHQHVGNYPGVTVEKRSGSFVHDGFEIELVDLPGTYSLSARSLDEKVAGDFILFERPDVIIDVVDSSNLERNFYLTSHLVEMGVKLVVVLNMSDRAQKLGQEIDLKILSARLRSEVIETVASRGKGIAELKDAIIQAYSKVAEEIRVDYGAEFNQFIDDLEQRLEQGDSGFFKGLPKRFFVARLAQGESEIAALVRKNHPEGDEVVNYATKRRGEIESHHGESLFDIFAAYRYGFAAGLFREAAKSHAVDSRDFSDRIDDIVTSRIIGFPIFLVVTYLLFQLTFTIGEHPMNWIESGFNLLGAVISNNWPANNLTWLKSLIVDGIIGGVGGVIVFLPNILLLFLGLSLLEDTGYMSRAAFIMDKLMHKIGLHGKSFIPMVIGFGCTVPAVMATRTLEHRRDRLLTMLILPLMSCGARLPIYMLIIPAFFPVEWRGRVLWIIYAIGILLAILIMKIIHVAKFKGTSTPFVMELPPYRLPTLKGLFIHMWERGKLYLKKAGTIILAVSMIMWFLTSYPKKNIFEIDQLVNSDKVQMTEENLKYSYAGRIGNFLEPAFKPLGFDWKIVTAFLGSFAAKEVFVSQMGIVQSIGDAKHSTSTLRQKLRDEYSPLIGICIMIFALIATPCMATCAVVRREAGSWKFSALQFFGLTFLAYVITFITYQAGIAILQRSSG